MANRFAAGRQHDRRATAARRSSPATSACCARACRTPSSSGTRTASARWKAGSTTLKGIVFHAKLGTQYERVERIEALAGEIAAKIGADVEKAKRAARLCKADLTTGVVGEFPELQGVMGRYYALHDNEDADVADAIRDHYKPLGPSDAVPDEQGLHRRRAGGQAGSACRIFCASTKSRQVQAIHMRLRRAALGVIRLLSRIRSAQFDRRASPDRLFALRQSSVKDRTDGLSRDVPSIRSRRCGCRSVEVLQRSRGLSMLAMIAARLSLPTA